MYLKSLTLNGFKSFAEKTTLEFLPGVTAIVGPNGCGKSNIADAIRWVLGEQSAKALRGSEMADVIFNGTDGRKPVGMCEVSMTFADVDPQQLSLPGVNLDFHEVTITRRVYRDGKGEYFINKTPCRLRDIQNLFMDTGIGRSSYSLMAQGQIDQILSAHPEDRRTIFEEAAGINKYKHQKKEALRKLEYTEQNLLRLTDIIKEVKRQIISLQRQAGKARRYRELFEQLKTLETRLARHRYDELDQAITGLETELTNVAAQSAQLEAEIAERETQLAQLRQALTAIEQTVQETIQRDHELQRDQERHQQRIQSHRERIAEYEQQIERNRLEIAANEEKIRTNQQDLTRLTGEFEQTDSELTSARARLETQQATLREIESQLAEQQRALDEARTLLFDLENQAVRHRNELAALEQRRQQDALRAQRLASEKQQLEQQRQQVAAQLTAFQNEVEALRATVQEHRIACEQAQEAAEAAVRRLNETTSAWQAVSHELAEQRARLAVLRQYFAAPDGRETIGQLLDVDAPYGAAVEAALNGYIHTVLVEDASTARQVLAAADRNLTVTAPDLWRSLTEGAPLPAGLVCAKHVARVRDSRWAPLVDALLANVVITEDLDTALTVSAQHPGLIVATRQGELIRPPGLLSRLTSGHMAEISALAESCRQREQRLAELTAQQAVQQQELTAAETAREQCRAVLHDRELALAGKQGEWATLQSERRDLDGKLHTVQFELSMLAEQTAGDTAQREQLQQALQQAEQAQQQQRTTLETLQRAVAESTQQKATATDTLTELRVVVGSVEHRRQAIRSQRETLEARVRDLQERLTACQQEMTVCETRIVQCRREIEESEQELAAIAVTRQQVAQHLTGLQHQRAEVATTIDQAETELRATRARAAEAMQQKAALDVALAQKQMERQSLKERIWQKYQVNVEDVPTAAITVTLADQGPVVSQQVELPTDWEAVEQQVAELQARLDAMGPVNLESIQEYDELEERHRFLTQQHDDLVNAKEQLLQVIAKINTTTRRLFTETFEKIRVNFQQTFTELFGGGRANLLLVDENDPLECGIEIMASPAGKQLRSISLLSGGERALTATALLFAIYMVKPSPFCVLDELDAPLDESNINRFVRILQRFVHQSQFVVITHNKRTIAMADALYGITMEEHGISKVVSVKFSSREDRARARATAADALDGAAVPVSAVQAVHDELHNELLEEKEQNLPPIDASIPIEPETKPVLSAATPPVAEEVRIAVAAATEAAAAVEATLAQVAAKPQASSS